MTFETEPSHELEFHGVGQLRHMWQPEVCDERSARLIEQDFRIASNTIRVSGAIKYHPY
jgi:hypothetical protein